MPPEVFHFRSLVIPLLKFSSSSPEPDRKHFTRGGAAYKSMIKFPARKLLPLLVFTLSSFSIFRLLRIAVTTTSPSSSTSPPLLPLHPTLQQNSSSSARSRLSKKEFKLLSNLIKTKAPCNLLIFGLGNQHLKLSHLNSGGKTLFLEDDVSKINQFQQQRKGKLWIHRVDYTIPAEKAYQLLKHARGNPECGLIPLMNNSSTSRCRLSLANLPRQVYEERWDVVVVDGPSGDSPEAPGRMSAIYMAGLIARRGGKNVTTHVVVHDVHRTIEKWFSWEFLCEENMVSSKGRLWSFEIGGEPDSGRFCADHLTVRY